MDKDASIAEDIERTTEYVAQQNVDKTIAAVKLAHQILDEVLAYLKPGMRESEVKEHIFARYESHALERPWHIPYIRFGEHTLLTYRDKAKEDRILQETDIAFVDIGSTCAGTEGDAGRTIAFGENKVFRDLSAACVEIFHEVREFWRANDVTGIEIYRHAYEATQRRGFVFNLESAGHLIGTFPHRGWKRGLNNFPHKLVRGVWILEIQIRHPTLPYGSFFEDLLI